ncbi:MAG: alpha-galactosidase, partial [Victivallales bacterium]|nr:alpha-galactosidase [Victivallales bacterium]
MSNANTLRDNIIEKLTDRLFSAVSGDDTLGRPPLPAFVYDGRAFNPRQWERNIVQERNEAGLEEYKVSYEAPDHLLALLLHFRIYAEYPVLEWDVELSAIGKKDTGEIDAFRSICLEIPAVENCRINARGNYGCKGRLDDFQPRTFQLNSRYPDNSLRLDTDDCGASSAWLPYFNFDFDENNGFELGIGWAGNWTLNAFLDEGNLSLEAGMKRSRFILHPGESIFAPSIYVMLRDGINTAEAQILHRRFLNEYHSIKDSNGTTFLPPQSYAMPGNAGQARLLDALENIDKAGGNVLEITRGWNGKAKGGLVAAQTPTMESLGDWKPNDQLYPDGFATLAAAAAAKKTSLALWLDICSAHPKSDVAVQHPDWFMAHFDGDRELLLNLGMKPARAWAFDTIKHFLSDEKVSHLVLPMPYDMSLYWEHAEKNGRQGAVEALFLSGWNGLMDNIHAISPDCSIQSNASCFSDFRSISKCIPNCIAEASIAESADCHTDNLPRLMHLAEILPSFTGIGAIVPGAENSLAFCLCANAGTIAFPAGYIPADFGNLPIIKRLNSLFHKDFHLLHCAENTYAYQLHDSST